MLNHVFLILGISLVFSGCSPAQPDECKNGYILSDLTNRENIYFCLDPPYNSEGNVIAWVCFKAKKTGPFSVSLKQAEWYHTNCYNMLK